MFILLIAMQVTMYSQDSISLEFLELYNKFRVENNLPPLKYSKELEEFADKRLEVVIKETSHCFPCRDWNNRCPTIDLHFKFIPMAQNNNADSTKEFLVVTENMTAESQFIEEVKRINKNPTTRKKGFFGKIYNFFASIFSPKEDTVKVNYDNVRGEEYEYKFLMKKITSPKDIPSEFFEGWKSSEGHNRNFRSQRITHIAFKTHIGVHNGREYLHGVWIGGEIKEKKGK